MSKALDPSEDEDVPDVGIAEIERALRDVLATTLVSSATGARALLSVAVRQDAVPAVLLPFAAALGSIAAGPLAKAIASWLTHRGDHIVRTVPRWFRPAMRTDVPPTFATLTEFANGRSRYVRDVIDGNVPVLLSRHGRVVAAVIPLQAGSFDREAYTEAARQIRAERRAGATPDPVVTGLTDDELDALKAADDKIEAAARLGLDLTDDELRNPLLADGHSEKRKQRDAG